MTRIASMPLLPDADRSRSRLAWVPLAVCLLLPLLPDGAPAEAYAFDVPHKQRAARLHVPAPVQAWSQVPYRHEILAAATASGVDPRLVAAVIAIESGFHRGAVSARGAIGLMQLLPHTARAYGEGDLAAPGHNIRAGAMHLARLLGRFEGDVPLALAAYNAGEASVLRHGGIPPFPETHRYVARVLRRYEGMAAG